MTAAVRRRVLPANRPLVWDWPGIHAGPAMTCQWPYGLAPLPEIQRTLGLPWERFGETASDDCGNRGELGDMCAAVGQVEAIVLLMESTMNWA